MLEAAYTREVLGLARHAGLDAAGVAPAAPFERARAALRDRVERGQHAGMAFTFADPDRSTDPGRVVRGARALVVGAHAYETGDGGHDAGRPLHGRVARYARTDHYRTLRSSLQQVADRLRTDGWKAVVTADENHLVDREAAYLAGLGWYGKNANVLLPGRGSWFVLGEVVTDAPLVPATRPAADGCGGCRRCLDGCPTAAIVAPGVVDARRCLAWLVQQPGTFPVEHRAALGDRIYGCDDCQEVCPPNHVRRHREPDRPDAAEATWVDLVALLAA
ncbi:MAG TPA: tRNA epoxyqueuosine(34) reductase QueG, partial [Acidimicrobiales bacterium]